MDALVPVETVLKSKESDGRFTTDCKNPVPSMSSFSSCPPECQYFPLKTKASEATNEATEHQKIYCSSAQTEQHSVENGCSGHIESQEVSSTEKKRVLVRPCAVQVDASCFQDQKLNPSGIHKQYMCGIPSFPLPEEILSQVDYRTRNKLKTKQRRMDPCYRDQERLRQRTVMQLKRQDPRFRAEEREKGRCRMRIKRLDPLFRAKERERQRERMKIKRQDPSFRERERELQKNRIHEKRLDPEFREREKARGRLRMHLRTNGVRTFPKFQLVEQIGKGESNPSVVKSSDTHFEGRSGIISDIQTSRQGTLAQANLCSRPQQIADITSVVLKSGDSLFDSFHYISPSAFNIHLHCNVKEHCSPSSSSDKNCKPVHTVIKNDFCQKKPFSDSVNESSVSLSKQHLPQLNDDVKSEMVRV